MVGIVSAVALGGVLTFVAVKLAQGNQGAGPPIAQPPPPQSFAIPGCYNLSVPPVERPKRLNVLGCASVAVALQDMSWSSWGPQGADGTGTAVFKVCDPNCAAGYQLTEPVVVHAWNPQPPRRDAICQTGLQIFADMVLAFPKGVPPPNVQKMNASTTDSRRSTSPTIRAATRAAPSSSATRSVTSDPLRPASPPSRSPLDPMAATRFARLRRPRDRR